MRLSEPGLIAQTVWEELPRHNPHVRTDAWIVMPNHVHGIIILTSVTTSTVGAGFKPALLDGSARRHGLPEIVRALKTFSARRINVLCGTSKKPFWQRGYYERVIRNERELNHVRQYIMDNPACWDQDPRKSNGGIRNGERTGLKPAPTMNSHPYPAYKPSGVEWLSDVPAHWEVRRLKFSAPFRTRKVDSKPDETIYVGLENIESWTGRLLLDNQPDSVDGIVGFFNAGDVLFGKLRPYLAKSARPNFDGVSTGEILALCPQDKCLQSYLMYCLLNESYVLWIDNLTYGAKMPRVSPDQVASSFMPLPPLPEQQAIAAFLDRETAKIDALVAKKERLIKLLQEKRTALITRAVTRGLDPDVPMKDSGVEWLGEIPAHWEVRRLKTMCQIKSGEGITAESIEAEGEYPVYGGNGLRGYTSSYTHDGEFALIGRQGALCGNVHLARGCFWASEHAVVATLAKCNYIDWFAAMLEAMNLNQYSIAAAQPGLAVERVMNLHVPVPSNQEQQRIANHIGNATAEINDAINRAQRQIELLKELRVALISAAVTGRIDVREEAGCS